MDRFLFFPGLPLLLLISWLFPCAEGKAKELVVIDQDGAGPGGSDMQSLLLALHSPEVELLGITVVSGDCWREEGIAHTLRLLEIAGRREVPVVGGAVYPLLRTRKETEIWEELFGKLFYKGAWNKAYLGKELHPPLSFPEDPFRPPAPVEGEPALRPSPRFAADFLIETARNHPGEVTLLALGPLTDIALACRLDPEFSQRIKKLVLMGASIDPRTSDPEWSTNPRFEFNFFWDPEGAHIVLTSPWKRLEAYPVDAGIQAVMRRELLSAVSEGNSAVGRYLNQYAWIGLPMWDEVAVAGWLDPSLILQKETLFLDVDVSHGPGYGNTLTWKPGSEPGLGQQRVEVIRQIDPKRFYRFFRERISQTPSERRTAE
ncbi:Inosine-uridine nucleoside N-ribohydrolase [Methylacidimicrobium sp. AP8]|uniref:nucleoside hydrolase n=1 Tax=Methylacidimicrobium sp. AP8 TaxID=2730359 RepID=UPI0018C1138E|nr:nucleoside hydrolase [Methylacidimicrobium sp. AP8]CAB4242754.1 Inosine-uridine nucleoside N-ribohydrolase [Methylacidimicrobium sp. AP8]